MALTLNTDYISSSTGNIGIGSAPGAFALDVNGDVQATTLYGDGSSLSGLGSGWEYYSHFNGGLSVGGTAKVARTLVSSAPAGEYMVWFALQWVEGTTEGAETAPSDDEDAASFYITVSSGTVRSMRTYSHEQNINGGNAQAGLQLMGGMAHVDFSSAADIRIFFVNQDGDTDAGGFGGWFQWMMWRKP